MRTETRVPLSRPYVDERDEELVLDVLRSGRLSLGPAIERFEELLAERVGAPFAAAVSSGTAGLHMLCHIAGVEPGDEVVTSPVAFVATANCFIFEGGIPVFADVDPRTLNLDPAAVEAAITERTKAIVPVHLYGLSADMKAVGEIARRHKLFVVEDNAQGIDGHGPGWKQGELSDAVCTSFIIQKNLGTFGDGGAVVTNRDDVDATVRRLRNHGSTVRSVHSMGYNSRLDDIHAAVLSVKLRHITKWTDRRRAIAARYTKGLQGTSLKLPYEPAGYRHVFHLYVVETPKRDALEKFLLDQGVDVKLHYPIAIHKQEGYPWGKPADLRPNVPNCERNAAQCLSLPMFPELTDDEVDYTIEKCVEWDRKNR